MKKIKYIVILFTSLFLISCENYDLDYGNINCSLDKTSYKINEDIVLSCTGSFTENNLKGYLSIDFYINKIINGEKIYENRPIFTIVDCGNLKNMSVVENIFSAYISENSVFNKVNETITLKFSEVGEYELHVILISHVNQAPVRQLKNFYLTFTVTEQ